MPALLSTPATTSWLLGSFLARVPALPVWIPTALLAVAALVAVGWAVARHRDVHPAPPGPADPSPARRLPGPDLAEAAARALIAADEDVRGAREELDLARAEFGDYAVAHFARVLDTTERLLHRACADHHGLRPDELGPAGCAAVWGRVLTDCRQVRAELAREAAGFARLRDLGGRVVELRAQLGGRLSRVRLQALENSVHAAEGEEFAATAARAMSTAAAALLAVPGTAGAPDEARPVPSEPLRRQAARVLAPPVRWLRTAERAVQQAELAVQRSRTLLRQQRAAGTHLPVVAGPTPQAAAATRADPLQTLAEVLDGGTVAGLAAPALLPAELVVAQARADQAEYLLATNRPRIGAAARVALTLAHDDLRSLHGDGTDAQQRLDLARRGRARADAALGRIRADLEGTSADHEDRYGTGNPAVDAGVQGSLFGDGWSVGACWLERA